MFKVALIALVLSATTAHAKSERVLECVGRNEAIRGCDGYLRLFVFETESGLADKAMLYSCTTMTSGQTWRGESIRVNNTVIDFVGKNSKGGSIELNVDSTKKKTFGRTPHLPDAFQNLSGYAAKLDYVAVYPEAKNRVVGKRVDLVCREVR